ncbi:uncharacterized protein [Haliotis asinina]|uniref:uncharacterized protein n=1 Tax=Haliotis asinina TaxID=109174 RepID=UPI003531DD71
MPRLSAEQRERAIGIIQMGASRGHDARTFDSSTTAVSNLIQRYQQTGQTRDRPSSGRPRIATAQEDRYIRILHLRNRFLTATSTAATALGRRLSRQTVARRSSFLWHQEVQTLQRNVANPCTSAAETTLGTSSTTLADS